VNREDEKDEEEGNVLEQTKDFDGFRRQMREAAASPGDKPSIPIIAEYSYFFLLSLSQVHKVLRFCSIHSPFSHITVLHVLIHYQSASAIYGHLCARII
jgi:hypothetical protein